MTLFELDINKILTGMDTETGSLFTGMLGLAISGKQCPDLVKFKLKKC
jgi:hypothetical protein